MDEEKDERGASYLIASVIDSCKVIEVMMRELSPHRYYTVTELNKLLPDYSENKVYRVIKTFEHLGWIEKHPTQKGYKIGHDLLYLSHRYFRTLENEHERIRQEINSFGVKY